MKRQPKSFLALFLALTLAVSPLSYAHAETGAEISETENNAPAPAQPQAEAKTPAQPAVSEPQTSKSVPEETQTPKETQAATEQPKSETSKSDADKEKEQSNDVKQPETPESETSSSVSSKGDQDARTDDVKNESTEETKTSEAENHIDDKADGTDKKSGSADDRADSVDKKSGSADDRADSVDKKSDSADGKTDGTDKKSDSADDKTGSINKKADSADDKTDAVDAKTSVTSLDADSEKNEKPTLDDISLPAIDNTVEGKPVDKTYDTGNVRIGGSPRLDITCKEVIIKNGKSYAVIEFSSSKYPEMKVGDIKYKATVADEKASFEVPVVLNKEMTIAAYSSKMEQAIQYTVLIPFDTSQLVQDSNDSDNNENTGNAVDNATTVKDGTYAVKDFTYSGGTGKTKISCESVKVQDGKAYATIIFSSKNYTQVKVGENVYSVQLTDAGSSFFIPVALGKETVIVGTTKAMSGAPKDVEYTICVTPDTTKPYQPAEPDKPTEPSKPDESKDITDGSYNVNVESDSTMFNVVSAVLTSKDGKMTAVITLSGTGYDKLFVGTAADAAKADASSWIDYAADADGKYTFTIPVSALDKEIAIASHAVKSGKWSDRKLTFKSEGATKIEDTKPEPPVETPVETPDIADGDYTVGTVESSASMFKVVNCVLTSKDGKMTAVITLSGTGYDYLFMGTAEDAGKADKSLWIPFVDADGKYTYTIPVSELDTPIAVAAHSIKNDKWYDRTLTFKSDSMEKVTVKLDNGDYNVSVSSSASMFKVVNCVLTSKDGKMTAVITLSGTGYDYLFVGTAEDAGKADKSLWIPYVDADGKYTYTIPVSELDTPIAVAAHSIKNDKWYDRDLTFKSEGIVKISGDDNNNGENTDDPNKDNNKDDQNKADTESKYESDTSGSTIRVDSSTTLKDGVYTPDKFSWSGGTGKVSITCSKVTITNGQAYATLVFSSDSYGYVKANGNMYYPSHSGGTSTFVIPVALNKNNKIIGMTTKMSANHEIEYTIYIYLAAADKGSDGATGDLSNKDTLDEEAPAIVGLEFKEEEVLDYAKYFKIYHYEKNITLLEIDMKTDTGREDSDGADDETAQAGDISDLYKENIVKYLIVPEDTEIPAGLDKEVIVVQLPADKAYAASNDVLEILDEIGAVESIAAVGCEKDDCEVERIAKAMEDEDIVFAGTYDEPEYKTIVDSKCNVAIMPSELLPEEDADSEEVYEKAELLSDISEHLALLEIPMIVDRSVDEETELAQYEWIKVYGVLFGCEQKADDLFNAAVAAAK